MPEPLTFRPATTADAAELADLIHRAYRVPAGRGWTSEAHLLADQRIDAAGIRAKLARPDATLLTARAADDRLVGCCEVVRQGAELAYFGLFAVDPDRQAAGVGRVLLGAAERLARECWGSARMEMTVIGQRADLIAWYVRRGYTHTTQRRPFPYAGLRPGEAYRDDLYFAVLTKELVSAEPQ